MRFEEIVRKSGLSIADSSHQKHREGWINFDCPYCRTFDKYHMGYNIATGSVHCWVCGFHPLRNVVSVLLGIDTREAGRLIPTLQKDASYLPTIKYKRTSLSLPSGVGDLARPHIRYLKQRGFDPDELVRLWRIRGLGVAGRYSWRVFIPITYNGEIVSWTTRSISPDAEMRYISAKPEQEKMSHKEILYGEEYCRNGIVVHEGSTDVWATGPGAVATMGLGHTLPQVAAIAKYPVRVICFDSEDNAQKRAIKLVNDLEPFPGVTYNVQLSGNDAATSPKSELKRLRRLAFGKSS